jgi:hypothetical protein
MWEILLRPPIDRLKVVMGTLNPKKDKKNELLYAALDRQTDRQAGGR